MRTTQRILGPEGSALDGLVFVFDGRIIRRRGRYLMRQCAEDLLPIFESDPEPHAVELARQLKDAMDQHDAHWSSQLEAAE